MAAVGRQQAKPEEPKEELVDYMAEAPPARPYSEAISDEHRKFLTERNIPVKD